LEDKEYQESEVREGISGIGILDIGDLSELLRVSVQTARRYVNDRRIPAYRVVPGKYLISVDLLKKHIEEKSK
jgi:excisionase family DNA binding protein